MCTRRSSAPISSSRSATIRSRSRLSSWAQNGPKVIHVGYQPAHVEQVYFPQAEVIGDLGPSLRLLADRIEGKIPHAQALLPLRDGILSRIADRATEDRLTPQRLVHDVRGVMPPDGIVALDNGMYKIWFARNYRTRVANTLLLDNALATMGAGLPSAMMAALLYPERRVMAVCGDGGFMMNSQELETAVRLKLNLVVLIIEDHAFGMIRWKQAVDKFPDFGMTFGNPDFVRYAEAYGAQATRVNSRRRAGAGAGERVRRRRRASRHRADRLFGKQAGAGRRAGAAAPGGAGGATLVGRLLEGGTIHLQRVPSRNAAGDQRRLPEPRSSRFAADAFLRGARMR